MNRVILILALNFFTFVANAEVLVRGRNIRYEEYHDSLLLPCFISSVESIKFFAPSSSRVNFISDKVGHKFKKDQVAVKLDSDIANSELLRAKANLSAAEANYNRDQKLYNRNILSKQQFEVSSISYFDAKAKYERAKDVFSNMIIKAPYDSISDIPNAKLGSYVTQGDYIISFKSLNSNKFVRFNVPEKTKINDKDLVAYIRDIRKTYKLDKLKISTFLNKKTASFLGQAIVIDENDLVENSTNKLELNYNFRKCLSIPETAVIKTDDGNKVYIAKDGVAKVVKIDLGNRKNKMIEVKSDNIKEGDIVIVEGLTKIHDGTKIKLEQN